MKTAYANSDELRRARLARGWSQAELSRRSGVSQANISMLETGKADPRVSTVAALAAALDLELLLVPKRQLPGVRRTLDASALPDSAATSVLEEVFVADDDEEDGA